MPTNPPMKVLLVEDDTSTRLTLAAGLTEAGYRPTVARSGVEATGILERDRCPIVITDWIMPAMDGLELCRYLRRSAELAGTYVIMLTVNSDKARLLEAFEAGVDDFLPKPFEPGVLFARMRAAVRTVELQQALRARNLELEQANKRLFELATTDDLTGLASRRHGLGRLQERWCEAGRYGRDLAVALFDIDHFKRFNDAYGHAVGDLVLAQVARVLRGTCREHDILCRYGGEELLLVMPEQGAGEAAVVAERCRAAVERHRVIEGPLSLGVTVSVGVSARAACHGTELDLVRSADDALYTAKESGRNAVRCWAPPAGPGPGGLAGSSPRATPAATAASTLPTSPRS